MISETHRPSIDQSQQEKRRKTEEENKGFAQKEKKPAKEQVRIQTEKMAEKPKKRLRHPRLALPHT